MIMQNYSHPAIFLPVAFDLPGESCCTGAIGTDNDSLGFCGISGDAARLKIGTGSDGTKRLSVSGNTADTSGDTARLIAAGMSGDAARLIEDCDDNGSMANIEFVGVFGISGVIGEVDGLRISEILSVSFISGLSVLSSLGSSGIGVLALKSLTSCSKLSMTNGFIATTSSALKKKNDL